MPPPYNRKAFTLSEVLITLVIIGIISAITVPSIIQCTQDKEFKLKFKKAYSTLSNAIEKAKLDEGLLDGNNSTVFTPGNSSYQSALNLSKNLNIIAVCDNGYNYPCKDYYHSIAYTSKEKTNLLTYSKIILSDGTHFFINQNRSCSELRHDCVQDSAGKCKKDEDGNIIALDYINNRCALVYIDVNGSKGPNIFGKDCFALGILKDKITFENWSPTGGNQSKVLYE